MRTYDCNQSKSYLIPIRQSSTDGHFRKSNYGHIYFQVFLEEVVTYEAEPADATGPHGFAGASNINNRGCPSYWILRCHCAATGGILKRGTGMRSVYSSIPYRKAPSPFFDSANGAW